METKLTKNQTRIGTVLIVVAIVFLYQFSKSNEILKTKTAKIKNVVAFFEIQKNENGLYTPENYLLDYYANINKKDYNYLLKHTLSNYNEISLKGSFDSKRFVGVKLISTEKAGKELAFVTADITYLNLLNDTISKRVKTQLQLSTDYKTWIVAPLTVY